eukprot:CAMPEP_0115702252 /NCGR_PEP_ID=MMETSP0272-20121206/68436_1 /TAXON_ID=71861 /ORGANISM="Scrippsiella trochoidea, Strain CCMP3099" /LENGTH=57 /DNA_ID=CAMNT_0003142977 /DNA_START=81 /DNA_END=254 /DNA_ORIENTATION=+
MEMKPSTSMQKFSFVDAVLSNSVSKSSADKALLVKTKSLNCALSNSREVWPPAMSAN